MEIDHEAVHYWFCLGNEYLDFQEFLQNELGFDEFAELRSKFEQQEDRANEEAYQKFMGK